jgi:hypothetical protein
MEMETADALFVFLKAAGQPWQEDLLIYEKIMNYHP